MVLADFFDAFVGPASGVEVGVEVSSVSEALWWPNFSGVCFGEAAGLACGEAGGESEGLAGLPSVGIIGGRADRGVGGAAVA